MDFIFFNSENGKTCDFHRLLLNLDHKIKLKRQILVPVTQNIRKHKTNEFKLSGPTYDEELEWLVDRILYQIFKIILCIVSKNTKHLLITF